MDWINLEDELPEKGIDVNVKWGNNSESLAFRCSCHVENCRTFKCSATGFTLGSPFDKITHWGTVLKE